MQPSVGSPLITLTTDFGLADHYVGTMKGVILSRCPGAKLIDISHEIPAFSLYAGAYTIDQAAPFYPEGTIHVVVVDPGVGTSRRALLVEALGQYFVAPDNGVLSMILARDKRNRAWEITNRSLWLPRPSSTFHGRDLFAPVAAAIASRTALANDVGPTTDRLELLPDIEAKQFANDAWRGKVLSVDRFGNIITNFREAQFPGMASRRFTLRFSRGEVSRWGETFGTAPPQECFAYLGSSGYLEVGINQASAARALKATPGDAITLQL
jgi:S-adenosyl-L-methionine hydrolase (adenosine-forming)